MNKIDLDELVAYASSKEMRQKQYETFRRMEPSSNMNVDTYRQIAAQEDTRYSSPRTILGAFAHMASPATYLEIGTRRGHSVCMVAQCADRPIDIYSFDLWIENYAGEANPGFDLIKRELQKFDFKGTITFFSGDSKATIPAFFQDPAHPSEIDFVFVDGDHSDQGARADILNVIDHVSVGGLLIFDDIVHPAHMTLRAVWQDILDQHPDYDVRECIEHEYGWAIALRTRRTVEKFQYRNRIDNGHQRQNQPSIEAVLQEQQATITEMARHIEQLNADNDARLRVIHEQPATIGQQQDSIAGMTRHIEQLSADNDARLRVIHEQQGQLARLQRSYLVRLSRYLRLKS